MSMIKDLPIQLCVTLLSSAVLIGIAYQTLAANDSEQATQIDRLIQHQEATADKVTIIQIDIARLATSQEHMKDDSKSIVRLLKEMLSEARKRD